MPWIESDGSKYYYRDHAPKWYSPRSWGYALGDEILPDSWMDQSNDFVNFIESKLSGNALNFWKSLTVQQKLDLLNTYRSTSDSADFSDMGQYYAYDTDTALKDLQALNNLGDYPTATYPAYGDYIESSDDIYSQIDAELDPYYANARQGLKDTYDAQVSAIDKALANLDAETAAMQEMYKDQLNESFNLYNQQANRLLSNQYLANAQTYDALQSDMRKSRQNALEAGASAGLRLANNVNTLLSAQNKQSQISMDTSNSLAEMLLQQRQAASGIRSQYSSYMQGVGEKRSRYGIDKANALSSYNSNLTSLNANQRSERQSRYGNIFNTQTNDYNRAVQGYGDAIRSYEDKASSMEGANAFVGPYTTWAKYK